MINNGYTSRNIPSPKIFEDIVRERKEAKRNGDKAKADALKLVVNTTYGAQLNEYNDLYDPLMARSVCISGQLYLLELAEHLFKEIDGLEIVALNTDGIEIIFDDSKYDEVQEIINEWQERTGFSLEEDKIKELYMKDISNYVEVLEDKTIKIKGGYLVRGISKAGAFNINNNAVIVAKAIQEYLVSQTPIEKTIKECDDILQFQFIAKASSKYARAYQIIGDKEIPTQKVNRVYASKNKRYGKLYKVKKENGQIAKIEGLPEHCIIDNDNHLTIDDIDKQYYIDFAKKRVNDFLGIKEEKMAETTATKSTKQKLNVWQKLNIARSRFLDADVKKTGFNQSGDGFFYFELKDIVPTATKIFQEVGLSQQMHFTDTTAYAHVYNSDNPEETPAFFSIPFELQEQIVSKAGKVVTPKIQCMGASVTYYRRYLWQLILDIIEQDEVDSTEASVKLEKAQETPKYTTPEKRAEITAELTSPDDDADELMVEGLKNICIELTQKRPDQQSFVDQIGLKTNGWTKINKKDCEKMMKIVRGMLNEVGK